MNSKLNLLFAQKIATIYTRIETKTSGVQSALIFNSPITLRLEEESNSPAQSGQQRIRLDQWLAQQLPDLSRSGIQKLIEQGQVKLNGAVCSSKKQYLKSGDRIDITIPDVQPTQLQPEAIPLDIIYEDDHLIFVNKPAGMVVHPSAGHENGTLVNALLYHCQNLAGIGGVKRPGIVHRLDKDTTGVLVVAKTEPAMHSLQAQIQAKTAQREYLAIIHGAPKQDSGTINQPIGRHPVERKKMAVVSEEKGGRKAVTHWEIEERLGNYTLMKFRLETGRTHQIRVHGAYLKHPIVGDSVYGSGRFVGVNLTGQVLHAQRLRVQHPVSGELIDAIASLPDDFTKLLNFLRERR